MRSGVPSFSLIIHPLHLLLEKVYIAASKRTGRAAGNVGLMNAFGEGSARDDALNTYKQALKR